MWNGLLGTNSSYLRRICNGPVGDISLTERTWRSETAPSGTCRSHCRKPWISTHSKDDGRWYKRRRPENPGEERYSKSRRQQQRHDRRMARKRGAGSKLTQAAVSEACWGGCTTSPNSTNGAHTICSPPLKQPRPGVGGLVDKRGGQYQEKDGSEVILWRPHLWPARMDRHGESSLSSPVLCPDSWGVVNYPVGEWGSQGVECSLMGKGPRSLRPATSSRRGAQPDRRQGQLIALMA